MAGKEGAWLGGAEVGVPPGRRLGAESMRWGHLPAGGWGPSATDDKPAVGPSCPMAGKEGACSGGARPA
ncbi:hypothetical protein GCM10010441_37430 [Kitasatospora paracochleata]